MARSLPQLYRTHYGQLIASITRITGDLALAEDSIQDAFLKATEQWSADQIPDHAAAWLMTTARNHAIDSLRRSAAMTQRLPEVALSKELEELERLSTTDPALSVEQPEALSDDLLRLIFTCCHPALNIEARVALCLSTVCGLRTDEIARAFIVPDATMSQRLWRAKTKIRDAGIVYRVPSVAELPARLDAVLAVIYLVFNEGWLPTSGTHGMRLDLALEAIRLARLIVALQPEASEAKALLGLMLLQHSRRHTRFDTCGQLVLLRDQDRSQWDQHARREGEQLVRQVFQQGDGNSRYAIMGAIACVHVSAATAAATDWNEIAKLYEHLMQLDPSAVIALNHAVAIGERDGPEAGLRQTRLLTESATMQRYYLFHSTQAEFLRRQGRHADARTAYARALKLTDNQLEKAFLRRQLTAVSDGVD